MGIENFNIFDRKIHIVRDPRDILVSYVLYWPLLKERYRNKKYIDVLHDAFLKKEGDPESVSLLDIIRIHNNFGYSFISSRNLQSGLAASKNIDERLSDVFVLKYDDLVDKNTQNLNQYLGFEIDINVKVGEHISFNHREGGNGGWRHWFTDEDVYHFNNILIPYIVRYDFSLDWTVIRGRGKYINPNSASGYLQRSVDKLSKYPQSNGLLRDDVEYNASYHEHLISALSDGIESAAIELALMNLFGIYLRQDKDQYEKMLRDYARRGNPTALVHLGVAFGFNLISIGNGETESECYRRASLLRGKRAVIRQIQSIKMFYERYLNLLVK